ncbi:hypothetical protein BC833DRAFT_591941 [Globomyces pollinis-pini]|nr:hypothetical protein BC833DRAFT_591941 [Globomyces pollinis-pini]
MFKVFIATAYRHYNPNIRLRSIHRLYNIAALKFPSVKPISSSMDKTELQLQLVNGTSSFSIKDFNNILLNSSNVQLSEAEVWKLYSGFLSTASNRVEIEPWQLSSFLPLLLSKYTHGSKLGLSVVSKADFEFPTIPTSCNEKVNAIKEDIESLKLRRDANYYSWEIVRLVFLGKFTEVQKLYTEAHAKPNPIGLNLIGYKAMLQHYCHIHFYKEKVGIVENNSDVDKRSNWDGIVTKRKVWSIVNGMRVAKVEADIEIYEYLLLLFSRALKDGHGVKQVINKLNAGQVKRRRETYILLVDALAQVAATQKILNRTLHDHRIDPECPPLQ